MAGESVGEIFYTVDARTASLLTADKQVATSSTNMQRSFDKTDKSANQLNTSISKLSLVISSFITAAALKSAADMINKYGEMQERVRMASSSAKEFDTVQRRLMATANGTYRSLSEASEVYIRTADTLRSMGYTTDDALDVVDSMSYAFVKNATSADRADTAISAFSKSMTSGKVSADSWETIVSAIPTVIDAIASSSGKTTAEIRSLGATGKLTATQLSEGLRNSLEENKAAADGMSTTLVDASVRMRTAITQVLVAFEDRTGALKAFTSSIISVADYILKFADDGDRVKSVMDTLGNTIGIVASILLGKFVSSVALSTVNLVHNAAANLRAATAATTLAGSVKALNAAFSMAGGLVGIITTAISVLGFFIAKNQIAKQSSLDFADSIDTTTESLNTMNAAQMRGALADLATATEDSKNKISDFDKEIQSLSNRLQFAKDHLATLTEGTKAHAQWTQIVADRENDLAKATRDQSNEQDRLNGLSEKAAVINETLAQTTANVGDEANQAAGGVRNLAGALDEATVAGTRFIQSQNDQLAILNTVGDREKAVLKARQNAIRAGIDADSEQMAQIVKNAGAIYDKEEAERAAADATKAGVSATKSSASAYESVAQKLENLKNQAQLATSSTEQLTREQTLLRAEQSLGAKATQAQKDAAREYAGQLYDATEGVKLLAQAEQARRFGAQEMAAAATMTQAYSGAQEDPAAQINLQEEIKLQALEKYHELGVLSVQQYEDYKTAIMRQAANERNNIAEEEADRQFDAVQSMLGSSADAFGSLSTMIENAAGRSSAAYTAMFAVSKAFAIAQSTLALNNAIMQAMADPTAVTVGQKFANYAAIASAGASLLSNITSASMGRRYGGGVSAGNAYRINEDGRSEIFQDSSGRQMFIPGSSGKVISADNAGGGGVVQTNSFTINTTGGIDDETLAKLTSMMKQVSQNTIKNEQRPGGSLQKSR